MDDVDDLGAVDPLQIDRCDAEVDVAALALRRRWRRCFRATGQLLGACALGIPRTADNVADRECARLKLPGLPRCRSCGGRELARGTDVPGDYRPLTEALDARQLAVTFAEVPPHTDFERGVGHFHKELEEIYLVSRGTLTMRCGEDVMHISAPTAVRVDPKTPRSYRNEGDDLVEMWVVSRLLGYSDSIKVPEFWSASSAAARRNR